MRKFVLLTMTVIALSVACHSGKRWQVSGEWKEGEGKTVYLLKQVEDTLLTVDSAVVRQGKYRMEGPLVRMDKYVLKVGDFQQGLFLDDYPIAGYFAPNKYDSTIMSLAIEGSREQDVLARSGEFMFSRMMCRMFGVGNEEITEYDLSMKSLVDSSLNLYTCALLLEELISTNYPFDILEKQYEALSPEVKTSWMGVSLAERIAMEKHIRIGGTVRDIGLPDPEGHIRKLSDLKGKWVIVDFWASWCGPCREKFPELRAVYEDYRNAGLEIYGVSLDQDKDAWIQAIAKLRLPWMHVSSLEGWDCPVVAAYRITAIPKMFLLDPQGRIAGIDLSEQELRAKLDTLLANK